ncbi:PREDICTED: uncharacterized protein LOC109590493 [Amphimedon queenslandica]|uniref:YqaJ viral recombinase domain-containing protein n=1 Tax=Amphimedon queenslandica TaxID=400682 RepID=A0AAN0JYG6_AMPQE|nr:PREDICTED: uncharacterized protein LOC109590493 [Amphimedon queenslandica]|eukprot:XP_019861959.1 PREDICTED: uncharacterized protein LOC109590493 [Amphimedon queenslandica]
MYGYIDMSLVAVEADTEVNLPMQLFNLYQPSYSQLPLTDLSQVVATTFNKYLRVTQAECDFLESSTRGQSSSYLWHDYRRGLITSSHFHSVLHHTGRAYPTSIVQTIMQYKSLSSYIPSLKWGREHEDIARKEYAKYMITHASFTVQESGLVINASYPFIGARSPDGIVNCIINCCGD